MIGLGALIGIATLFFGIVAHVVYATYRFGRLEQRVTELERRLNKLDNGHAKPEA